MAENLTCCECGMIYGVPEHWVRSRREDKRTFYCPNGHAQSFTKSRADKLAEELSRERQRLAQAQDEIAAERKRREQERELRWAAERRVSAARGQVTKLKKRASGGVCPCCNRTFAALQRHMAQKHPGFIAEPIEGDNAARQ